MGVTSPTSQLNLQPFRRFTYFRAHSPTLLLLHLRHSSFSNPSFASSTSQALHLIHLASLPSCILKRVSTERCKNRKYCKLENRRDVWYANAVCNIKYENSLLPHDLMAAEICFRQTCEFQYDIKKEAKIALKISCCRAVR